MIRQSTFLCHLFIPAMKPFDLTPRSRLFLPCTGTRSSGIFAEVCRMAMSGLELVFLATQVRTQSDRPASVFTIRSATTLIRLCFFFSTEASLNDSTTTNDLGKGKIDRNFLSWDMNSDTEERAVLKEPFRILGTSADDESANSNILSTPLMHSLQDSIPYGVAEQNFWMKYSLARDGASLSSLLRHIRGAKYTILALETADGEVFGSFTSEPWENNLNYFGTGESFLWRISHQFRNYSYNNLNIDQGQRDDLDESDDVDVFPWTGENNCIQLCTHAKIAIGGGSHASKEQHNIAYGFGIAIDRDMTRGTSSHCATFGSPPLSKIHPDGSPFEIMNLEVWTLTPCFSLEDAEKLELCRLLAVRP